MLGKPRTSIVEELNNVLTVVAMCTDELETLGPHRDALSDLRDAVRRGAELTRLLATEANLGASAEATATIVVLEGDPDERHSMVHELGGGDWHLIDIGSPEEAFERLESVRAVDVLVTDTSTSSRRFASRLVERYPAVAVVYTGDYTNVLPRRDELPKTEVSLLARPFVPGALASRVRETLARVTGAT